MLRHQPSGGAHPGIIHGIVIPGRAVLTHYPGQRVLVIIDVLLSAVPVTDPVPAPTNSDPVRALSKPVAAAAGDWGDVRAKGW